MVSGWFKDMRMLSFQHKNLSLTDFGFPLRPNIIFNSELSFFTLIFLVFHETFIVGFILHSVLSLKFSLSSFNEMNAFFFKAVFAIISALFAFFSFELIYAAFCVPGALICRLW